VTRTYGTVKHQQHNTIQVIKCSLNKDENKHVKISNTSNDYHQINLLYISSTHCFYC